MKGKDTWDRYLRTTSCTNTINATATFRFNGTGIWWMTYGLDTNDSTTVTLDGTTHIVSLYTGIIQPQAVLWGQNNLLLNQEHTVVVNNPFGSTVNVDAFIVEQFVAPAANVLSLASRSEERNSADSKGEENNAGLIAGLTTSAFLVGMLLAFLICYIHRTRHSTNGDNLGVKSRDDGSTILPFVNPTRGNSTTQSSRNLSHQAAIPWEADYNSEQRDRVVDLVGPSTTHSRWRERVSRAILPNPRSAARNRYSIGSGTMMTESNLSNDEPRSPATQFSASGMTLSSYFNAPSTMPSVGVWRTRDRYSLLTD